jgi:hypothetical protein
MPASPTVWKRGPFKILLSPSHQRVRIEYLDRFETVTVDAGAQRLRGDARFEEIGTAGPPAVRTWRVEGWNTTISLLKEDAIKCAIECDGRTYVVSIS